jgi:light-regulated signal transduction histidine kinase (bacteriophytochrome)
MRPAKLEQAGPRPIACAPLLVDEMAEGKSDSPDRRKGPSSTERAMLNILDDFDEERIRVRATQSALVNILEDAGEERQRLSDTQRAILNILDDFETGKNNVERANLALRHEVMERSRAEDALLLANKAAGSANQELEAFSYSVAHDMRAPLRSIDGFSLALLEDCAAQLPEEGKAYLGHIRDSAQHMARLIDDLLALSRVSRAELKLADVDMSAVARAAISRLQASDPALDVEIAVDPDIVTQADPRLIHIALANLLGNAWKFSARGVTPRIEFGRTMQGPTCVFFVRDNGVGFDMAYADKLFQPFQRLHKVSEFEGTGIGLATVQRIIGRHGGRIWAEGQVGLGATLYFTLGADE